MQRKGKEREKKDKSDDDDDGYRWVVAVNKQRGSKRSLLLETNVSKLKFFRQHVCSKQKCSVPMKNEPFNLAG